MQYINRPVVPNHPPGIRTAICALSTYARQTFDFRLPYRPLAIALSTCGALLSTLYVLVVARREHNYRIHDCFKMLYTADVAEFMTIWIVVLPASVRISANLGQL